MLHNSCSVVVFSTSCPLSNSHSPRKTQEATKDSAIHVEISDKRADCWLIEVPLRTACRRGRPGEDHVSSGWDVVVQVCRSVPKRYVSLSMHPRDSLIGRSGGSQRRSSTDRTAGKRCPRPVPLRVQIPHVRAYRTGPGGKDEMKACAAMEPAMSVHACSVPFEIDDCADTNLQWNGIA